MTPLERAARALHKDYVEARIRMGVKPSDLPTWEDLGPDGEFSFYAPAFAVIEAIREPSEAMAKAAANTPGIEAVDVAVSVYRAMGNQIPGVALANGSPVDQAYTAMIDALLEEGR